MKISTGIIMAAALVFTPLSACAQSVVPNESAIRLDVTNVLLDQSAAWNRGDIDGFMAEYWKSPKLRFASGGSVETGWQPTNDRYKLNYPNKETMGILNYSELKIDVLSPDAALIFCRWTLTRGNDAPTGLTTLTLRKIDGDWLIVSDHTSS